MKRQLPLLLLLIVTFLLAQVERATAQSQPLVIVVRDGAGNPLQGVPLVLYVSGPPHQEFDNCVTDELGECSLIIAPGAYIVTFTQGWRGHEFIPVEEQNGGSVTDGGIGGFGIYLEPSSEVQFVTFVIGQRDGQLIPLWDMSRDPAAVPQPFAYPDSPLDNPADALSDIDLAALDTTISDGSISTADPNAQVVVEQIPVPALTATTIPAATPTFVPIVGEPTIPSNVIRLGIFALVAAIAGVLVSWWVISRMLQRKEKSHG
jgi:hypothetical protein